MIRRLALSSLLLALAVPARSASKDTDRIQFQIAGLSSQIAELQRLTEENTRELRRLNEALAEQNALLKKTVQDQRLQDEAVQTTLKEIAERLAVISERFQSLRAASPPAPVEPGVGAPQAGAASPAPGNAAAPSAANPPPPPRELYSQAYADFARGNYDLAVQGFQEYLRNYPNTDFSDNAQYWIGECYYGKQRYTEAIEAWNVLLRDYPSSDKLPEARYKKGMALEKLGRRSQALLEYRYVVDHFPNTQAARLARERLSPQ